MNVVILNFMTGKIDVFKVPVLEEEIELYIEETLNYSLTNCEWMAIAEEPVFNFLN
jgi:hypothetical protein